MATAINIQSSCSEAEWKARQRLAACYRIFAYLGWDEMIFNHITLKVPDEDDAFLINPYGLHFSEVTASTLVKIDIDGNTLDGSTYPVNKAGFTQHSLFHRELPDVHAIIHTHTTATMAVSSVEGGLQPINFYAAAIVPRLAYHKFEHNGARGRRPALSRQPWQEAHDDARESRAGGDGTDLGRGVSQSLGPAARLRNPDADPVDGQAADDRRRGDQEAP